MKCEYRRPVDIYSEEPDKKARYLLGVSGKKMIACVGINPSTADQYNADLTVKMVESICLHNGFDGLIMLNVYPQRATNPNNMDLEANEAYCKKNIKEIQKVLKDYHINDIWCAWGNPISTREYLRVCLRDLSEQCFAGKNVLEIEGKRTKAGNPGHPSRKRKDSKLVMFKNYQDYVNKQK